MNLLHNSKKFTCSFVLPWFDNYASTKWPELSYPILQYCFDVRSNTKPLLRLGKVPDEEIVASSKSKCWKEWRNTFTFLHLLVVANFQRLNHSHIELQISFSLWSSFLQSFLSLSHSLSLSLSLTHSLTLSLSLTRMYLWNRFTTHSHTTLSTDLRYTHCISSIFLGR